MNHLAKLGFSQSYTYFAWRNTKWEISQYFQKLTETEVRNFFRPNLWPHTPDMLTEYLQKGGRPAFVIRLKDFVVIDFEGEPARPISERRTKRSPLRDVAGMLRSFHYAVFCALFALEAQGITKQEALPYVDFCAGFWYRWTSSVFLKAYLDVTVRGGFLPSTGEELQLLLDVYLLEKAIYELGYELNNRPAWVKIPVRGILQRMSRSTG